MEERDYSEVAIERFFLGPKASSKKVMIMIKISEKKQRNEYNMKSS